MWRRDYNSEMYHYGVKGMKWGVRRYTTSDGRLNEKGLKKYRKRYDLVKREQNLAEKNQTGIKYLDDYNSKYYNDRAKVMLKALNKKIGDKGLSQLDEQVINEGRDFAKKAMLKAQELNDKLDLSIRGNEHFLTDPQREYDKAYNKYIKERKVNR